MSPSTLKSEMFFLWTFLLCSGYFLELNAQTLTTNSVVRLTQEATCPDAAALAAADPASVRQIVGVSDARVCSVACATWNQCAVSRYLSSTRTCQLGNQAAWLQLWQPAAASSNSSATDCASLIRGPLPSSPLLPKLLALYNFRFGTDNLASANPGALPAVNAAPSAVRTPRIGFSLPGDYIPYLQADLGGQPLSARLGSTNKKLTIYARLTPAQVKYTMLLVQNRSRLNELKYSVKWSADFSGAVSFVARDLSSHKYSTVGSATGGTNMFSAAVSFDPSVSTGMRFYYNGTWKATEAAPSAADANAILGDEVLQIGYDHFFSFKGFVHCFAVAADTLELSQLWQLEEVC